MSATAFLGFGSFQLVVTTSIQTFPMVLALTVVVSG